MLIVPGIRHSIFWIFGRSTRRYQACHDGNSCFELVGVDEWSTTTFPQIEHCSDLIWREAGTAMGPKEASDSDFWSE